MFLKNFPNLNILASFNKRNNLKTLINFNVRNADESLPEEEVMVAVMILSTGTVENKSIQNKI